MFVEAEIVSNEVTNKECVLIKGSPIIDTSKDIHTQTNDDDDGKKKKKRFRNKRVLKGFFFKFSCLATYRVSHVTFKNCPYN